MTANTPHTPHTLILRSAGTNCDLELAHGFELAGATTQLVHLNKLIDDPTLLEQFDILAIPGGFSHGDDIAAGRILANRLRHRLYDSLHDFISKGKPIIGICNGFQVLVKAGLLTSEPLSAEGSGSSGGGGLPAQAVTLTDNAKPRFVDRWVELRADPDSVCIWTRGLDTFPLPIAHGEGRFVASEEVLAQLVANKQVALKYIDNPNGSMQDIAGICDTTGLVFGLMPHPERYTHRTQHPQFTRMASTNADCEKGCESERPMEPGLRILANAVEHVRNAAVIPNSAE